MRLLYAATFSLGSAWQAVTAPGSLVDLHEFFKNPVLVSAQISPDGNYVAYLAPWQERLNVWVKKTDGGVPSRITNETERDVHDFKWTTNNRLVYERDTKGDENFKLFSVQSDGSALIPLLPGDGANSDIIAIPYNDPRHILVRNNQRDKKVFDAFRVDVETGQTELLVRNPGNVTDYAADHEGVIRIETVSDGVTTRLLYRPASDQPFKEVLSTNFREQISPQCFTADNRHLIATSNLDRDKGALVEIDPATTKEVRLIYQNPDADVDNAIWSDAQQKLVGASYTTDRSRYVYFDATREKLQHDLEARLPGVEIQIVNSDREEKRWVVRTWGDRTLGAYFLYEVKTDRLTLLGDVAPWIDPSQMATMTPITYSARDGVLLHGYLTLPAGVEPKGLPLVIIPHGGPWARDRWGFNSQVQFLANRGYAVLQVNFRGSTGYGRKFWELGFGQWGRTMQDDLTDGVQEMIRRGIADPKRVGIYGYSYGGYATLAGVAFTPDLYAAAVDYVGVSNLETFMKTIPPYWLPYAPMFQEMIGPDLAAQSPVNNADKIRTPLLIVQGANDPRVKKDESDQMVKALRARAVDVPYMVKENEGHGFHNEENRFAFYRAMEQFLGKYLGGRIGTGDDVLRTLDVPAPVPNSQKPSHP